MTDLTFAIVALSFGILSAVLLAAPTKIPCSAASIQINSNEKYVRYICGEPKIVRYETKENYIIQQWNYPTVKVWFGNGLVYEVVEVK